MLNRFSLAIAFSLAALFVTGAGAQTVWERSDKNIDKQKRNQTVIRTKKVNNGVIVATPDQVIVRTAPRPPVPARAVNVRVYERNNSSRNRNAFTYSYNNFERSEDYEDRVFESNRYGNVAEVARLNGYRDGLREGTKDSRDGDSYNPFGEHAYKDGATGYISKYGNRKAYQQFYRQSFVRGYREAFDRYLGANNKRYW